MSVTDEVLAKVRRDLRGISQRLLGTREIILIHHTDCGMLACTDDEFKKSTSDETGIKPAWAVETFSDLDEDVRQSIKRIKANPFVPHTDQVRGFVFDVATGKLNEVVRGPQSGSGTIVSRVTARSRARLVSRVRPGPAVAPSGDHPVGRHGE